MKRRSVLLVCSLLMVSVTALAQQDGFYKDLFQDSGINLTSRVDLPAARFLGLRYETYYSAPHNPMEITAKDTVEQTRIMVGSEIDQNGVLLYPDGAPRFKMIYVNGGRATKHGNSLTEVGREHIRQFVAAGGSYVGSCAGSFIASMGNEAFKKDKNDPKAKHHITGNFADGSMKEEYLGVYPARTISTDRLEKDYYGYKVYTGIKVVKKSRCCSISTSAATITSTASIITAAAGSRKIPPRLPPARRFCSATTTSPRKRRSASSAVRSPSPTRSTPGPTRRTVIPAASC